MRDANAPMLCLTLLSLALAPAAQAQEGGPTGEVITHARVSALEGTLFVRGPFDEAEQEATLNTIVREGDHLRAGDESFAELELPRATFVRFAPGASVTVVSLQRGPDDAGAGGVTRTEVHVERGAVYLSRGGAAGEVSLSLGSTTLGAGQGATVRGELEGSPSPTPRDGEEEVVVAKVALGSAQVSCGGETTHLLAAEVLVCSGSGTKRGSWAPAEGDAFDRWSRARETFVRRSSAPEQVAEYEGAHDLDGNGAWLLVDARWYWRPHVAAGWRPYFDGYWTRCDPWGWTWISRWPWGHVTHHYGRWTWLAGHGWVWAPGGRFAGAWVVWAAFDGYVGWAPCDFWGRPIFVYSPYSYYDPLVWAFARPGYFWGGGGHRGHHGRDARDHREEPADRATAADDELFTISREDLRDLRPLPIRDPSQLAPERLPRQSASKGEGGGARTGVEPRVSGSLLPELLREESARKLGLHELGRRGVRDGSGFGSAPPERRPAEEPVRVRVPSRPEGGERAPRPARPSFEPARPAPAPALPPSGAARQPHVRPVEGSRSGGRVIPARPPQSIPPAQRPAVNPQKPPVPQVAPQPTPKRPAPIKLAPPPRPPEGKSEKK